MNLEMMTAIGAVTVSVIGGLFNYYKLKDSQKTWEHEQKLSIEKELLFKRLKKRYALYSRIFTLLGYIKDIEYPKKHHLEVSKNKKKLAEVADNILLELYGESGLFMEYKTRSLILKTYQVSYKYINNKASLEDLIDSYYYSRRAIRRDLEFDDSNGNISKNDILKDTTINAEKKQKIIQENKIWSINNVLANSSRPGYPNKNVDKKTLNDTVKIWKNKNIKSIICLLSNDEIKMYYNIIDGNLINFYKEKGFNVYHISVEDFQSPPLSNIDLDKVDKIYKKLEHPILIHCGAGEDRTGQAIEFLKNKYFND